MFFHYDLSLVCAVLQKLFVVLSQKHIQTINPIGFVSSCLFVTLSVRLLVHPAVFVNLAISYHKHAS